MRILELFRRLRRLWLNDRALLKMWSVWCYLVKDRRNSDAELLVWSIVLELETRRREI